jgi:hypothetical protein
MPGRPFDLTAFTRDLLAARGGDANASARLVRTLVPAAARALVPKLGGVVDVASTLYDELAGSSASSSGAHIADGRFWRWAGSIADGVIVVIGSPRTGKTSTLCQLAELWAPNARGGLFCVGVQARDLVDTPLAPFSWSEQNLSRLPVDSVLLIPDAGLYLDARAWGEGPEETMRRLVILSGQRRVKIAADAQYSALIARSLLSARALVYKAMGPTFMTMERSALRPLAEQAQEAIGQVSGSLEQSKQVAYAYVDEIGYAGLIGTRPPEWYSQNISNSHRYDDLAEAPTIVDVGEDDQDQDLADELIAAPRRRRRGDSASGRPPSPFSRLARDLFEQ